MEDDGTWNPGEPIKESQLPAFGVMGKRGGPKWKANAPEWSRPA